MKLVNIHDAKANLSKLVDKAARGEPFVIAKAGKPLVKVVALESPSLGEVHRVDFMTKQLKVPDDFDRMGARKIARLFVPDPWTSCRKSSARDTAAPSSSSRDRCTARRRCRSGR
jgi:prevent-host-death family protein